MHKTEEKINILEIGKNGISWNHWQKEDRIILTEYKMIFEKTIKGDQIGNIIYNQIFPQNMSGMGIAYR